MIRNEREESGPRTGLVNIDFTRVRFPLTFQGGYLQGTARRHYAPLKIYMYVSLFLCSLVII